MNFTMRVADNFGKGFSIVSGLVLAYMGLCFFLNRDEFSNTLNQLGYGQFFLYSGICFLIMTIFISLMYAIILALVEVL